MEVMEVIMLCKRVDDILYLCPDLLQLGIHSRFC
jgi:hypothetical protein